MAELSDYSSDEIWLFTLQSFILEVTKYDMKAFAEQKEHEVMLEELELKNRSRHAK